MLKNLTKENSQETADSCVGLFDSIILAITQEKQLRQTKEWLYIFITLLTVSLIILPFSLAYFILQWNKSGVVYFISTAFLNINMFFVFWQDFTLSIFENLPVGAFIILALNIGVVLFTIRLFLHKKGVLLKYLKNGFAHGK